MTKMKKSLAALLACAIAVSTSMTAFAANTDTSTEGDQTQIDSEAEKKTPVYSVSLPTDMDTYLTIFGDTTGSQITTAEQLIINKSEIPVKVTVKACVEGATGVSVKTKPTQVVTDDPGNTDKDIYIEAVALPGTWTPDSTKLAPTFAPDTDLKYRPDDGGACLVDTSGTDPVVTLLKSKNVVPAAGATSTAPTEVVMTFALGAATGAPNAATPPVWTPSAVGSASDGTKAKEGAAAYRFMGSLNPNAAWSDTSGSEDVKLHLIYSFGGMQTTMYDQVMANSGKYNPTGKETNMVDTHMEKFEIKKSDGTVIHDIEFTATDGVYAAPTGLTVASTKSNITVTGIASVELVDSTATVPANNGMTYIANTKTLNVMPTWVTLATAPLKNNTQVEVKINFNYTVEGSEDVQTDYITVTLKKTN